MKLNNSDQTIIKASVFFKTISLLNSASCLFGAWVFIYHIKQAKLLSIFWILAAILILINSYRRKIIIDKQNIIDLNHIFSTKTYSFNKIDQYSLIYSYTRLDWWGKTVDLFFYNKNKNEIGSINLSAFNKESIKIIDEFLNKNIRKINQI